MLEGKALYITFNNMNGKSQIVFVKTTKITSMTMSVLSK